MTMLRRKFDWATIFKGVAGGIVGLVLFAAGFFFATSTTPPDSAAPQFVKRPVLDDERQPFVSRLGSAHYSSHDEELFIRDFFSDRKGGYFLDVGASHYRDRSNTYYLETVLGWSGLAIDPLVEFAADYRTHRTRTKFIPMFVSDKSDADATVYIGANSLFSSGDRKFTDGFTDVQRTVTAKTITLDDLLAAEKVERIDFMSVDIELHEPQALAGFDLRRFRPELVCIEAHPQVRQQILDYFAARDYVVVGKYLRADPQNLWFMPARRQR